MAAAPATGPFYLPVGDSRASGRFCFFRAPAVGATPRGAVLAVHAFAEELNKTRVVAADAARAFAAAGFAVLQIDLAGSGDSAGDFADASWTGWLDDLAAAWTWLSSRSSGPRWLWGTRLGAIAAEQFAARAAPPVDGLLLWQPVVSGAQHLGQFLRLKTVGGLLRESSAAPVGTTPVARVSAPSPRADLASGRAIEVAGYRLTPALADAMEAARLGGTDFVPRRVRWLDVSSQAPASAVPSNPASTPASTLSPIAARVVERWRVAGGDVAVATVAGPAFWQTQEVERCLALVDASVAALVESVGAT